MKRFSKRLVIVPVTIALALVATLFVAPLVADAHSSSHAEANAECIDGHIVFNIRTFNGEGLAQTVEIDAPVKDASPAQHHLNGLAPRSWSPWFTFTSNLTSTPGGTTIVNLDWSDGKGPDGITGTGDDQNDPHSTSWNAANCPVQETTTTTIPVPETRLIPPITIEAPPETPKVSTGAPVVKVKNIKNLAG